MLRAGRKPAKVEYEQEMFPSSCRFPTSPTEAEPKAADSGSLAQLCFTSKQPLRCRKRKVPTYFAIVSRYKYMRTRLGSPPEAGRFAGTVWNPRLTVLTPKSLEKIKKQNWFNKRAFLRFAPLRFRKFPGNRSYWFQMISSAFQNLSTAKRVIRDLQRNAMESIRVTSMRTFAGEEMLSYFDVLIDYELCRPLCRLRGKVFDEGPVDALHREII